MNETGRGGRFIVERLNQYFDEEYYKEEADF